MLFLRAGLVAILLLNVACRVTELEALTDDSLPQDSTQILLAPPAPELMESPIPYRPSRTRTFDLLHTKLEVRPNIQAHTLDGTATLQLRPYFHEQKRLQLDAKGFKIHELFLLVGDRQMPLRYDYDGKVLDIELDRTYTREEDLIVEINYTAHPDEVDAGGSEAITKDQGLYFIGTDSVQLAPKPIQVWTQGETQANSCWFPTIDAPNERTTQEMLITVDTSFQTLSNGNLISSQFNDDQTRTDYWKMDMPHAPYLFMMAIGDFAIVEDQWRDRSVSYYVEPEYQKYAKDIFGHTPEMLEYFSDILGVEYPWPKYAQVVVRDFVSGAMENTTASVFMEGLQVDSRELLDYDWDNIIAHELFHHWFGDLVTCESWANLPLNESFATYSEYLWRNYKDGEDEAAYTLWEQGQNYFTEAEEKKVDLIRFHYEDQEDMFDRHSYDKGSRILHMLRAYLGDEAFFVALQQYLEEHAFSSVEVHELRMAFEEVSGEDLNWFFNQWFLAAGHPELSITQQYDSGKLVVNVRQQQNLEESPVYRLPTSIEVWTKGKSQRYTILIDEVDESYSFDISQKPEFVIFDPESTLLAKIDYTKTDQEWIQQYKKSAHVIKRIEALDALARDSVSEATASLYLQALKDDFWMIRQIALNTLEVFPQYLSPADIQYVNKMAKEDSKSLVRADALSLLAGVDAEAYQSLFKESMQDSSYAVVGSAIAAYTITSADDKLEVFSAYEAYSNFNVVIALADFYVENSIQERYSWFAEKFMQINDEALYYLLNYFARYLIDLQQDEQQRGIKLLAEYAKNHPKYYVRLNAYRSLSFFDEQESVQALQESIRNEEQDPRLKAMYESIP